MHSPFTQSKRWSILPAYTIDGYIAHIIHHGTITTSIFNEFVRSEVLPQCTPFPGPRSVLITDNARIHISAELEQMCQKTGVVIARLPPYSPDFNPIETSFAMLKKWIRRYGETALAYETDGRGFQLFLHHAVLAQAGVGDPGNLFRKSYIPYP